MDRKEFIRSSGRLMILGSLVILTGGLMARKRISLNRKTCGKSSGPCSECGILSSCSLPEAVKFKNYEKNKGI